MARARVTFAVLLPMLLFAMQGVCEDVRIGVLGLFHPTELTIETAGESWAVLSACGWSTPLEPASAHARARLVAVGTKVQVDFGSGVLIECERVQVASRQGTGTQLWLSIPNKIRRRYTGTTEITSRRGTLVPVISMDLEAAVASVVAAESAPGTPIEALKAQAVAARSYLVAGAGQHSGFDFCDTTHCQFLREVPGPGAATEATSATSGLVLTYEGRPIAAMYSASCGGRTHTLREIGVETAGYPYFAVDCPFCRSHADTWVRALETNEINFDANHNERKRLALGRRYGWATVPGNNYKILSRSHTTSIEGRGAGHGIGLCQAGASAMADAGADFITILAHYYANTGITEVRFTSLAACHDTSMRVPLDQIAR